IDGGVLYSVAEHIFLPPRLPQIAPDDVDERSQNTLLCRLTKQFVSEYQEQLPPDDLVPWSCVIRMLEHLQNAAEAPLPKQKLRDVMRDMQIGDIFAMHIRRQNAAIVMRRLPDETVFEIFEVSPPNRQVMAASGKLVCSYPGPAASLPSTISRDPIFLAELASFLVQMDVEALDAGATIVKANHQVREDRDTADPRYISQLLFGILRGAGKVADIDQVTKRIADDVSSRGDASKPWRRAPL
ncbi:hypothetical protein BV25DRAFT_1790100, partial [Artomyces pyxidatus]